MCCDALRSARECRFPHPFLTQVEIPKWLLASGTAAPTRSVLGCCAPGAPPAGDPGTRLRRPLPAPAPRAARRARAGGSPGVRKGPSSSHGQFFTLVPAGVGLRGAGAGGARGRPPLCPGPQSRGNPSCAPGGLETGAATEALLGARGSSLPSQPSSPLPSPRAQFPASLPKPGADCRPGPPPSMRRRVPARPRVGSAGSE